MKSRDFMLFALIIMCNVLAAQIPNTLWTQTYGGTGHDIARFTQQTSDGGFILVGVTESFGSGESDFWLIKTDEIGNEEWNQSFGGTSWDEAYSVNQTTDGGFILGGCTNSYGAGESDFWLVKTDEIGNEEWNRTFGGENYDTAYSANQTTDGGFIIGGFTSSYGVGESDFWLIKTDENGNEEWNQTFGGLDNDKIYSVKQTTDGGFILAGYTNSYGAGESDLWLVKTDEIGNEEWNQTYGGSSYEIANSIQQTSDGGFILAGYTNSYGAGESDFWLVKTDENGNEEWNQSYDNNNESERAQSIIQANDNGFIIAGYVTYTDETTDIWIVKTDEVGNEEWNQTFGGNEWDRGSAIQQTADGGFVIAGSTSSYGLGGSDFWLIRLDQEISIADNAIVESLILNLSNYPNPFNPTTTISFSIPEESNVKLSIYNIKGQKIKSLLNDQITSGEHSIVWNGEDDSGKKVSSGVYLYKLNVNGKTEAVRKCLLLK